MVDRELPPRHNSPGLTAVKLSTAMTFARLAAHQHDLSAKGTGDAAACLVGVLPLSTVTTGTTNVRSSRLGSSQSIKLTPSWR